ncbi:RNA degradosome polyphosphate kinase [Propionibacterium acidifaciens]|uniref:RNA degradosome polyphosphate kinase n=1 Tax=Propionibacterium acidifaciens TaxID=556499 RepID=UPI0023F330EA|nr:RNA degradosome polyphosphate kinase [Propionibacterium acidifaciens]
MNGTTDRSTAERTTSSEDRTDELPKDRYSERELSWLAFNNRVLDLARDAGRIPLLERAKFTAIFSSNLDEFFMVRVAGLKRRIDAGVAVPSVTGMRPRELYDAMLTRIHELVASQAALFQDEILPALRAEGIDLLRWGQLTADERARMDELFTERIYPVLTPLAVDPSHPFPYISGLSLNIGVLLRNPANEARQFARIKVPGILDRFIRLAPTRFVPLEEVIIKHLSELFSGMQVASSCVFRVTRNEDVEVEEDDAENLLFALEKELLRRKVGRPPVRLEVEETVSDELLELLAGELDISEREIFRLPAPLDLTGLFDLADVDREDLKYPNFLPKTHPDLAPVETSSEADLFKAIKRHDVLLHHPYDSFATSVQRFVEQAASDPHVLAIKQTLYRTSGDSPIIDALIEAAEAGKQVLALVEIKARFDEQNNIAWARKLERHGVHVVYGMIGLKTHCKLILVVRDEPDGLRRYAHIGTGNYNPKTARQYEDMGLLTCNPIVTDDVSRLFNHLSGMTAETSYRRLLVAPNGVRSGIIEAIDREIEHERAGRRARIRIKVNSIIDEQVIDALYRASRAGVQVDLWVRGICGIRPGVPGLSENIRVISVLGRFLEHSRIFWFENDGHPAVGIGSADMMHRNLDRRVEAIVSITNQRHIDEIGELFDLAFDEDSVSWRLHDRLWRPDTRDADGGPKLDIQEHLIARTAERRQTTRTPRRTLFIQRPGVLPDR